MTIYTHIYDYTHHLILSLCGAVILSVITGALRDPTHYRCHAMWAWPMHDVRHSCVLATPWLAIISWMTPMCFLPQCNETTLVENRHRLTFAATEDRNIH